MKTDTCVGGTRLHRHTPVAGGHIGPADHQRDLHDLARREGAAKGHRENHNATLVYPTCTGSCKVRNRGLVVPDKGRVGAIASRHLIAAGRGTSLGSRVQDLQGHNAV